ncbi:Wzz/FepE/Etk N-terminal domain-containing protein [Nostocoides sp. Soil756]|uniref:Wzz/FepE/Etk N-terminal domain-containing protein n=1 Tax=Nostocoides sp. Soil756 TaxID=1736399 RepID=UPI000A92CC24|nr:Wzz/FepE/Etk N-terminal domain-containing protein [Tetrasphaera sp. Soil756]
MTVQKPSADIEFAEYLVVLRRRWGVVVLGVVVGLLGAVLAGVLLPKTYSSTASVIVQSTGEDGAVAGGRTTQPLNLDTEAQIVKSTAVAQLALDRMRMPPADTPTELSKSVSVAVPPNTSVLNITFFAPSAQVAQDGAESFATAYLDNRKSVAEDRSQADGAAVRSRIDSLQADLSALTERLASLKESSSEYSLARSQRDLTVRQLSDLNSELLSLSTGAVQPGSIITDAQLPLGPSTPNTVILAISGLLIGLVGGVLLAFLVDRSDRRLRDRRDLQRLGLDPLVQRLSITAPGRAWARGLNDFANVPLRQLGNTVLAGLPEGRGAVLVAGVSDDGSGSAVAVRLATVVARSGYDVLLVSANLGAVTSRDLVDGDGIAGLADVLRGEALVEDVASVVEGIPTLRVIGAGTGTTSASTLPQSIHSRDALDVLTSTTSLVVIDVTPTTVNADAQSLAALGLGVLLVGSANRTDRRDMEDAIDQLAHVHAFLLGAVLVTLVPTPASDAELSAEVAAGRATLPTSRQSARGIEQSHPTAETADGDQHAPPEVPLVAREAERARQQSPVADVRGPGASPAKAGRGPRRRRSSAHRPAGPPMEAGWE